jgi:urease accessory protein
MYLDRLSRAGRETREAAMEEEECGRSLGHLMDSLDLSPGFLPLGQALGQVAAMALLAARSGVGAEEGPDLGRAYIWLFLENQVGAAAKCFPLGQRASQKLLWDLLPKVLELSSTSRELSREEWGFSLPFQAILSSWHENEEIRLFRS